MLSNIQEFAVKSADKTANDHFITSIHQFNRDFNRGEPVLLMLDKY